MEQVVYVITISVDEEELTPETHQEMLDSAEPHDSDDGLRRWLGDAINDTEEHLGVLLPEGFSVKIAEVQ